MLSLAGREHRNFDIFYDPRARGVIVGQLTGRDERPRYDIWTSFMAKGFRTGAVKRIEPGFSLRHFSIEAALDASLHLKVLTKIDLRIGVTDMRSFPFEIARAMKVTSVRVDGAPVELLSGDPERDRAYSPGMGLTGLLHSNSRYSARREP